MKFPASILLYAALASFTPCTSAGGGRHHNLDIEAGYHVIYSYPGLTPPDKLFDLISAGKVGGISLNAGNVDENLPALIDKFQRAYRRAPGNLGQPLPIMTDQEGGLFHSLPGPPERTQKDIGSSPDPKAAAACHGREAAQTLRSWDVHINLGPVLAVYREPGDFMDQYNRSYSNDPEIVATCASSSIHAQKQAGIIPVAKHFPGLGAASAKDNTDLAPVTLDVPLSELRYVDILPYKRAMEETGLDMVMFSWGTYPAVDAKYPAGLSKTWVQRELRKRLRFKGVTVSETLGAGSLEPFGGLGERAVLASRAGMDLILVAFGDVSQGEEVHKALVRALKRGHLDRRDFMEATKRILRLRKKLRHY